MQAPHYRKIELQSPADLTYLYTNAVAQARQKLDLHLPPSANDNDPLKARVKELVDEFIKKTFTYASESISINGLDFHPGEASSKDTGKNNPFPFPSAFTAQETVEYEPYDTELASRVTSLYAQLESLTTTVAQLRREAPRNAAKSYADALNKVLQEENEEARRLDEEEEQRTHPRQGRDDEDVEMKDSEESSHIDPSWELKIPFNTKQEEERWRNGEMASVYSDALRTLLRLQGESVGGEEESSSTDPAPRALATSIGLAERAGKAAEVVEKI